MKRTGREEGERRQLNRVRASLRFSYDVLLIITWKEVSVSVFVAGGMGVLWKGWGDGVEVGRGGEWEKQCVRRYLLLNMMQALRWGRILFACFGVVVF